MPRLHVRLYPGARPWLPSPQQLQTIDGLLTGPVEVELHPRASLAQVWRAVHHGEDLPGGPDSIRAWTSRDQVWIFVDRSETRRSALWLFGHELAHAELNRAPFLKLALAAPANPLYLVSDDAHEAAPEEQFANRAGATLLELLTGRGAALDRRWWRRRMQRQARATHTSRLETP